MVFEMATNGFQGSYANERPLADQRGGISDLDKDRDMASSSSILTHFNRFGLLVT